MRRVFVQSLGCPKNLVDSEVMLGRLLGRGCAAVADPAEADVLLVNTCAFIEEAKEESIAAILDLAAVKEAAGGQPRLVVAGCFAQRYADAIREEMPEVDVVIGTGAVDRVADLLDAARPDDGPVVAVDRPCTVPGADAPRVLSTPRYTAYLKIAEGCSQRCTFCIIPRLRGRQRSRPVADVVAEARRLAAEGVRELNLVAQARTHYGPDRRDGTDLAALLRALDRTEGIRWIRLLYAYPHQVTDALVAAIAECDRVVPYLDMPIQHADDAVLLAMQRRTTRREIEDILRRLRDAIPDIVLRTSFIVGFPGETEAQFERLLAFVSEQRFDRVGVFTYSAEEGTRAARWPDDVPAEVKAARRDRLMELQQAISAEKHARLVGRTVEVLVEGPSAESEWLLEGRTAGQAPEIDGVTYVARGTAPPGAIVPARVVQAGPYDLVVHLDDAASARPVA